MIQMGHKAAVSHEHLISYVKEHTHATRLILISVCIYANTVYKQPKKYNTNSPHPECSHNS